MAPPRGSLVYVSSPGFTKAARELLSLSASLAGLATTARSFSDRALRARCPSAAAVLGQVEGFAHTVTSQLEVSAVVLRERATWAKLAEEGGPSVGAAIDRVLAYGPEGIQFLLASATAGATGLQNLADAWHTTVTTTRIHSMPVVREDLVELIRLRQSEQFAGMQRLVDRTVFALDRRLVTHVWAETSTSVTRSAISQAVLDNMERYVARMNSAMGTSERLSHMLEGRFGLKGAAIDVIVQLLLDANNPYRTRGQKIERAAAMGAGGIATLILGEAACVGVLGLTTGPGALACGAAVGLTGTAVTAVSVDYLYKENKLISSQDFQKRADAWRKNLAQSYVYDQVWSPKGQSEIRSQAYAMAAKKYGDVAQGTSEWAASERYASQQEEAIRQARLAAAPEDFYKKYHYPPRGPIDKLYLEETDRAAWADKMAEIRYNRLTG